MSDPWRVWAGIDEDEYLDEHGEPIDPTPTDQWEYTTPAEAYMTDAAYELRKAEQ